MVPDRSMTKMMSSGMGWASALVEEQAPLSLASGPPSTVTSIPPVPPVPPVPEDPEDPPWPVVLEELVAVVCVSGDALQPHHAATPVARVSDTKTGRRIFAGRLMECSSLDEDIVDVDAGVSPGGI